MIDVCQYVKIEPELESLTGEKLNKVAIKTDGARSDISARGFLVRGQRADIRLFNAHTHRGTQPILKKFFYIKRKRKEEEILSQNN